MQALNFSTFNFRFKNSENKRYIFDVIRKKFIVLTPEEWVRQHVVHFLISEKNFPISLINVEKLIKVNNTNKRYDIVVYNPNGTVFLIVECKAPKIKISQSTFDQIAQYNFTLQAKKLMVTNGINHYFCEMDFENEKYTFLEQLDNYNTL